MPTKQQLECLRWTGALGHRFIVIEPSTREADVTLYGGWRCCSESGSLQHALLDGLLTGQVVFEKVVKRGKYGVVRESWRNVTPKEIVA